MKHSAGIAYVFRDYRDTYKEYDIYLPKTKILLGHVTNKSEKTWSIPKGGVDEDETIYQAALREFKEECGIDLQGYKINPLFVGTYRNRSKRLYVGLCEVDIPEPLSSLKCETTYEDTDGEHYPEMDKFGYFTFDEAIKLVAPTQKDMIRTLKLTYGELKHI